LAFGDTKPEALQAWNTRHTPPMNETLVWRHEGKPDEDETVLVQTSEHEVDAAFVREGEWLWACGLRIPCDVVFWTRFPDGLQTRARRQFESRLQD
jgi:hypothetical protein